MPSQPASEPTSPDSQASQPDQQPSKKATIAERIEPLIVQKRALMEKRAAKTITRSEVADLKLITADIASLRASSVRRAGRDMKNAEKDHLKFKIGGLGLIAGITKSTDENAVIGILHHLANLTDSDELSVWSTKGGAIRSAAQKSSSPAEEVRLLVSFKSKPDDGMLKALHQKGLIFSKESRTWAGKAIEQEVRSLVRKAGGKVMVVGFEGDDDSDEASSPQPEASAPPAKPYVVVVKFLSPPNDGIKQVLSLDGFQYEHREKEWRTETVAPDSLVAKLTPIVAQVSGEISVR